MNALADNFRPSPASSLLRAAQLFWLVVTLSVIGLQVIGVPALYRQLAMPCVGAQAGCEELGQLTDEQAQELAVVGLTRERYAALITVIEVVAVAIWMGMGMLIFLLRAHDWIALLVSLMLIVFGAATFISGALSAAADAVPQLAPLVMLLSVLGDVLIVSFFLLFPNGRLVPRALWWLIPVRGIFSALDYVPGYYDWPPATWLSNLTLLPVVVIMVAAQVYRYRRQSTARERNQTRWVVYGVVVGLGAFVVVATVALMTGFWRSGWAVFAWTGMNLIVTIIPITFGIAMLRSNLWDVDVVIRRTTTYAILTALLAVVYFGSVVVLQRLLLPLTGQSAPAVALSTLLIAALFLPLRRRVQTVIDRRFFRRKYDAEKVLARFAATARDETDLDALTAELERVIQETMQPAHVSVWLRPTAGTDGRAQRRR